MHGRGGGRRNFGIFIERGGVDLEIKREIFNFVFGLWKLNYNDLIRVELI